MLSRFLALSGFAVLFGSSAIAADYCNYTPVTIYDGGTGTSKITVVVSNVPRPVYPGHGADRPWCIQTWRSLGASDMPTIVEKPSNGELRLGRSWVSYKGNKIGHDHFVIEKVWYGRMNEQHRAKVDYDVEVVAGPF